MVDRDILEETGRYTLEDLAMSPAERERCELRGRIMAAIADVVPDLGDREYEACADRVLSAAVAGRQVSCDRCAAQVGYVVCDDCQKTLDRDAGRQVVDLPEPDADTGRMAVWRPGGHLWLVIEAWADPQAIPLVRCTGSTHVAHVVRERALALLAAADRAEQMAAERTAGSGSGED